MTSVLTVWERTVVPLQRGVVNLSALHDRKSNGTPVTPIMQVIDADGNTGQSKVRMTGRLKKPTEEGLIVHRKKLSMLNVEQ